MNKISVKTIAEDAIIAALYVALTWALLPISYGGVQFRISEALMLLVILNRKYAIPLVIGCFIANTTSPLGWPDMVFGTLATLLAVLPMLKLKNIYLAALCPVVSNAIIVSIELGLVFDMFQPIAFLTNLFTVALGEAVVLYLVGIPAIMSIGNEAYLVELMELDMSNVKTNSYFNLSRVSAISLSVIGLIFFIAYPIFVVDSNEGINQSIMQSFSTDPYVVIMAVVPVLYLLTYLVLNNKLKHIIASILPLLLIGPYVALLVRGTLEISIYAYFYPLYIILLIIVPILELRRANLNN